MSNRLNLVGKKFGMITVISLHEIRKSYGRGTSYWNCKCDCGKECIMRGSGLDKVRTRGKGPKGIKSCGCLTHQIGEKNLKYKGYMEISGKFFTRIKRSANKSGRRRRNIKFDLSIEDLWNLFLKQNRKCSLTGAELFFPKTCRDKGNASLDRIDSSKNYTIDNVQWVQKNINTMKMAYDQNYFIDLCRQVTYHQSP